VCQYQPSMKVLQSMTMFVSYHSRIHKIAYDATPCGVTSGQSRDRDCTLRQVADDAAEGAEQVGRDFVRRAESAERAGRETLREAESTLKDVGSDVQDALQDFGAKLRSQGGLLCSLTR